jgi:hypothetical protein
LTSKLTAQIRGFPGKGPLEQTGSWMQDEKTKARFIEPMLLERAESCPKAAVGDTN